MFCYMYVLYLHDEGKPLPFRWRLFLYVPKDTEDNRSEEQ